MGGETARTIYNYLKLLNYDERTCDILLQVATFLGWNDQIAYIVFKNYEKIIKEILEQVFGNEDITKGLLIHIIDDTYLFADILYKYARLSDTQSTPFIEIATGKEVHLDHPPLPYKVVTYNFVQVLLCFFDHERRNEDVLEDLQVKS